MPYTRKGRVWSNRPAGTDIQVRGPKVNHVDGKLLVDGNPVNVQDLDDSIVARDNRILVQGFIQAEEAKRKERQRKQAEKDRAEMERRINSA